MIIGIVGKANVGKSTFFKAATLAEVEIANYPFATIDANEGVGFVRTDCAEKHFKVQCNPRQGMCLKGQRFVPVKLLDVAGLVPGAHEGKGLGNKFLDDLRQADAFIHVIDASGSTNEVGEPIKAGSYDPLNDVRFLEEELDLWFHAILRKSWDKFAKQTVMLHKPIDLAIATQFSGLKITLGQVKKALTDLNLNKDLTTWSDDQLKQFATSLRKASKPMIIAANKADVSTAKDNIIRLKKHFKEYRVISCSAESELALREAAKKGLIDYIPGDRKFSVLHADTLNAKQKKALNFIARLLKQSPTGIQQCLNTAVYDLLGYITIFPGGVHKLEDSEGRVLPDAFLMPPGSTAIDFAAKLHTDFAKNFIRAIDVKTKRTVGKDHVLQNGDVVEIVAGK